MENGTNLLARTMVALMLVIFSLAMGEHVESFERHHAHRRVHAARS